MYATKVEKVIIHNTLDLLERALQTKDREMLLPEINKVRELVGAVPQSFQVESWVAERSDSRSRTAQTRKAAEIFVVDCPREGRKEIHGVSSLSTLTGLGEGTLLSQLSANGGLLRRNIGGIVKKIYRPKRFGPLPEPPKPNPHAKWDALSRMTEEGEHGQYRT